MNEEENEQIEKISHSQLLELLKNPDLEGYRPNNASISKIYRFDNFMSAIDFMVKVSRVCEEMNHHPNWKNIYDRVEVDLSTHELSGVTVKDIELARKMNELFNS